MKLCSAFIFASAALAVAVSASPVGVGETSVSDLEARYLSERPAGVAASHVERGSGVQERSEQLDGLEARQEQEPVENDQDEDKPPKSPNPKSLNKAKKPTKAKKAKKAKKPKKPKKAKAPVCHGKKPCPEGLSCCRPVGWDMQNLMVVGVCGEVCAL